ncbi:DegT/DnrJ/EryC1/StrS family aminotransferase [Lutimonas saemankumensis]|uniref:DegT/DnrJ/EryC1/StrS family aminotransferase n=1 Tax=Lutimonas saemankumensis TaxID=483016 RepID=UPI001CD6D28A|nr:DegT/DnrJ/EryC1/StrS family aminotransferase [Lutimonas saemankumensis]MCA0932033.1 DegT/DnrJ/EryC1/StrS family aminotransferase [Lutimonas saemankumensis]
MPGFELFGDAERKELNDVLENGVLMRYGFDGMRNGHWKAKELEQELQNRFGVNHAQLTSSGTTALNVALAVMGVGAGDEVIMPCFTFVASFESILASGATPVLVEIDDTLTLDPAAVEAAITPRTKVIMPVHMCGSMADLDALQAICDKHNLLLLEDACQAFGGSYKGKMLGAIGDAGTFSFDFVKTITCGEGGALLTNNSDYATWADQYSDHGHDHIGSDRGAETHPILGYNFRISELHAAVGLGQIKRMDEFIAIQRRNHAILKESLSEIPEVSFRRIPDPEGDSCGFLNFFMPTAELSNKVVEAFASYGIDAYWNYFNNNWHYIRKWDHFKELKSLFPLSDHVKNGLSGLEKKEFPQSDDLISRNISCLIKLSWTEEEVRERAEKMAKAIKSVL